MGVAMKTQTPEEYVQVDDGPWAPFPDGTVIANVGWLEAQAAWQAFLDSVPSAA